MSSYSDFQGDQQTESGSFAPIDFYEYAAQQNKRDADSRESSKGRLRVKSYPETCQRCGNDLGARVHIWNGRRLCNRCIEEGQEAWELAEAPNSAIQKLSIQPQKKARERSLSESLISGFLALLGLKRIENDIASADKIPIKLAELLSAHRPDRKQVPDDEGIMGGRKWKGRMLLNPAG